MWDQQTQTLTSFIESEHDDEFWAATLEHLLFITGLDSIQTEEDSYDMAVKIKKKLLKNLEKSSRSL